MRLENQLDDISILLYFRFKVIANRGGQRETTKSRTLKDF